MFKFIKRFFGLDYDEPKKELPTEFAPILDAIAPKPIDRSTEEKKVVNPMDPFGMLTEVAGKKKKPVAKKPAAKKAAPKKATPKR